MYPINIGQLASMVGGKLIRGNPQLPVRQVYFIDPNRKLSQQLKKLHQEPSASVVIPEGTILGIATEHALITAPNPKVGLWKLLQWQRSRSQATFIGITGSSGKTTTKEMIAEILKRKFRTLKSKDNQNVAGTIHHHLLRLDPRDEAVVLEMGMSDLGNIRRQCQIAKPSIGVVTCVKEAHVGSLGSSLQNVVRAKQELVDGVPPKGMLILNADDAGIRKLNTLHRRKLTYGIKNHAVFQAKEVRYTPSGMSFNVRNASYQIPTWGIHNVYNALAAITTGYLLKVPVKDMQMALQSFPLPKMRLQKIVGQKNRLLINDAYNANPTSMIAGLEVLRNVAGRRHHVAILGDMHELGALSESGHRNVGSFVAKTKPSFLVTVGTMAAHIARAAFAAGYPKSRILTIANRPLAIAKFLHTKMPPGSVFYFKASRKMKLEDIVRPLQADV
ncbi:UDP-N-acetylmuramoyl-tripeptide--D-alanyl-D-alanine ligase [Marininema halotolerans]|uniref:UDP-N-acetylmuramoyl-tripeptide--D-alanyl-D- alanine ligase n=1 Tax=Marininema halotolerans TaxID=1155944 RepID=UPI001595CCEA|nr:UDP-N-acetylmuramoyl-tripeptide--D-alanyl-D-alanine ligase [Marininema halotolerans]